MALCLAHAAAGYLAYEAFRPAGSHRPLDAVAPFGVQLLWPLDSRWLHAPFALFGEIIVDRSGRAVFLNSLVTPVALLAWMREMGMVMAVVASVQVARAAAAAFRQSALDDSVEP